MGDARDPSPGAPARRARSGLWAGAGLVAAAALALLLAGGARAACEEAGPDAGGYKCETTDFDWKDTSGGTDLSLGDDDYSAAIDLPFAFRFYGADKTRAWVGSNGLLCFATAWCDWPSKAEIVCVSLPGQPCVPQIVYTVPKPPDPLVTDDFVACFWEDLDPTAGGTVRHKAVGDAPNRVFVVEFKEVKHKGSSLKNTFQIQLLEKGEARCMLDSVSSDGDLAPTVVAIENAAGSAAVVYKYGGVSESDRGVRFFCALNTAPRNLDAATGPGVGEVSLTWEAPGEGCAPQKSRVYRGTESGGATFLAELGEVTAFTDSGLPNGAVRYYQVTAVNPAGEGPRSGEVVGQAPDVPGRPRGLLATMGPGAGNVTLRWDPPADDHGFPVTSYRVYRASASGEPGTLAAVVLASTDNPADPPRLGDGAKLVLQMDSDDHDQPASGKTRDSSPGASHGALENGPGNAAARFGNGYDLDGSSQRVRVADAASLRPADAMTVMLWFKSDSNSGQRELVHKYKTAPSGYFLEIHGGNSQFVGGFTVQGGLKTVSTSLPTTGEWHHAALTYDGSAVRLYVDGALAGSTPASGSLTQNIEPLLLGLAPGGGHFDGLVDEARVYDRALPLDEIESVRSSPYGPDPSFVDGLPQGVVRYYTITAVNLLGEGPRSNEARAPPGVPSAPRNLAASTGPGAGQITLTWEPPELDNGSPVTGYRVHRGSASGAEQFLADVGDVRTFTDGGLPAGSTWFYVVSALNAVGEGPWSDESKGRAPAPPGPPRNLTGSPYPVFVFLPRLQAGGVKLTWQPPLLDGGVPVKAYRVYRGPAEGQEAFLAEVGNATSFVDNTTPPLQVAHYRVSAVNVAGEGPRSGGACTPPYPWTNGLTPLASRPCPLPAGWRERVLLTQDVPAPAYVEGISTPAVSNYGVTVDGRPRAGSPYYDLTIGVFSRSTLLPVPTFGLLQEPVHVELLRGSQSVSTPAWVRLTVSQRSDPSQQGCALGFGPCAPLPVTWRSLEWLYFQGAGAMLLVEAQLLDGQGRVLAGQVLTIPYGGQFAGG